MFDFYDYDIKVNTSTTNSTGIELRSVYDGYYIDSVIQKYCKQLDSETINEIKREPEIKKIELTEVVIDLGI